jgi:hypothetical protein
MLSGSVLWAQSIDNIIPFLYQTPCKLVLQGVFVWNTPDAENKKGL